MMPDRCDLGAGTVRATAVHARRRAPRVLALRSDDGDDDAMDDHTIARWRLRTLRLSRRTWGSAPEVVSGLLAVQAENHAQASWAVATRTHGTTEETFARLFDHGVILRTHVLRPTWHFVTPDDIRWLVALTAPRVMRQYRQLARQLTIDQPMLDRSAEVIVAALAGGVHLTRAQLGQRLREEGLPGENQALGVLLANAEMEALICSGAMQGPDHTHALLAERAPDARRLERDEAVAELALRYFTGHGPATERDLAYWATMTLTDVRAGLAAVADRLDHVEHDGRTWWFADPPPPDDEPTSPRGHLLQVLDEYHNGYQDTRGVLDVAGLVPRGRRAAMGMVLLDGQMVAEMRRQVRPDAVTFQISRFRDLTTAEVAELQAAADRYGAFLDRPATLVMAPAG